MLVIEGTASRVEETADLPRVPTDDRPYRRLGILILLIAFGVLGGWSALAPLDSAIVAPGQLKVEARRKTIQHLEGGIVQEIAVTENQVVQPGQLLIRLSDIQARTQFEIVRQQHYEMLAEEARLITERDGKATITFPAALQQLEADPTVTPLIEAQRQVFKARRDSHRNEEEILRQRVQQLREQIRGLEAQVASENDRVQSFRAEVKEWEGLYKEQLTDKTRLLDRQRTLAGLEGDRSSHLADIARIKVQIGETESQILLKQRTLLSEVVERLREVQAKKADFATRIIALEDTLKRTEIRSPVYGSVVGLDVHTIGAVVPAGRPVMEIVPLNDEMVVEAMINVTDIDKVVPGLPTDLRFSAFSSRFTFVIEGRVKHVSADALQDPNSRTSYYRGEVIITPAGWAEIQRDKFNLIPGMPVEVIVKTGQRTVLEYLVKPISDMFARAFKEE